MKSIYDNKSTVLVLGDTIQHLYPSTNQIPATTKILSNNPEKPPKFCEITQRCMAKLLIQSPQMKLDDSLLNYFRPTKTSFFSVRISGFTTMEIIQQKLHP